MSLIATEGFRLTRPEAWGTMAGLIPQSFLRSTVSPLRRIVTHRHSALAFGVTACVLTLLIWRPWQSRATLTAASVDDMHTVSTLVSGPPDSPETKEKSLEMLKGEDLQPETIDPHEKPTIIGSWRDDFYGKRVFHFRDDGTATMTIELDAIGQAIYGSRLKFFIDWKQDGDILKLKMTRGEPPSALAAAKLFGETSEQRIESIDEKEMKLRSLDSNKLYVHRRLSE